VFIFIIFKIGQGVLHLLTVGLDQHEGDDRIVRFEQVCLHRMGW